MQEAKAGKTKRAGEWITAVNIQYFVGSNPTKAVIPWQTKRRKLLDIENAVIGVWDRNKAGNTVTMED